MWAVLSGSVTGRRGHTEAQTAELLALNARERVPGVVDESNDAIAQASKRVRVVRFTAVDKDPNGRAAWGCAEVSAWDVERTAGEVAKNKHQGKTQIVTVSVGCCDGIPVEL